MYSTGMVVLILLLMDPEANNDDGIEPREDDENPNGQYIGRFYF